MNSKKIATAVLASMLLTLGACKKDPPHPHNANEEFERVYINFVKLTANGTQTTDTVKLHFDKNGVQSPTVANLATNTKYRTLINLETAKESVNPEIIQKASEHKFFFFATPASAIGSYAYNDGIGLDGVMEIKGTVQAKINVLLRHGLNKNHADAQAYNSPNYQNAGGDNDLNINIAVQPI